MNASDIKNKEESPWKASFEDQYAVSDVCIWKCCDEKENNGIGDEVESKLFSF